MMIANKPSTSERITQWRGAGASRVTRSRRGERGAAVFVVVLVITLLTSLGVLAVKNATLSNKASGYNRQLTQTHYVTDYAVVTTVADLMGSLHEAQYILENRPPVGGQTQCEAMSLQAKPKCMLLSYADLDTVTLQPLLRPRVVGSTHGSLGPGNLSANIWIEITDPYDSEPPAGYQVGGGSEDTQQQMFSTITVSVTGLVQPQAGMGAFDTASATAAGFERQRARVKMGPILAQK